jgi:ABC-type nitrate/sulfonate/bicarbonate transport system ATPase subunit
MRRKWGYNRVENTTEAVQKETNLLPWVCVDMNTHMCFDKERPERKRKRERRKSKRESKSKQAIEGETCMKKTSAPQMMSHAMSRSRFVSCF